MAAGGYMGKILASCILLLLVSVTGFAAEVTSPFGWRIHPISGVERFHTGADIGYDMGEPIPAMLPGKVAFAAPWGGYGNCVILEHANGDHTLYGHMSEILVTEGQRVGLHEIIGLVGSTGYSTGPHLHLEWWHNGQYVNPLPLYNMSPQEAYAYAPTVVMDAPIQAVMASNSGGEIEGFGFGFNKDEQIAMGKEAEEKRRQEIRKRERRALPMDYTKEQLEQMRKAVQLEAVAEAKRQLAAEAEASKERVFFKLGF